MSSLLLGPTAARIHCAAQQPASPAYARSREVPTGLVQVLVAPAIRIERSSRCTQAHQLPRQRTASSPRTFAVHSRNSDPPNTPEHKQGQGALSYFVAHLPAIPPAAAVRSKRSPTASHPTPADWPGESRHSTLLLAPANALTSTDGKSVGLPAMVGIFRRLYDWLLSLFWYVLTVTVSSFSCRLMSRSRRCRMSPEADDGRHMAPWGEQPVQGGQQNGCRM